MRISLFLLLLPLMTWGQAQDSALLSGQKERAKRSFRIGLLSQFDAPLDDKYVSTIDGPLMRMRRTGSPNLTLDLQAFRNRPEIYFTAGIGYQAVSMAIDTLVAYEYLRALNLGYYDEVELDYLQLTFGLQLELFAASRLSPYLHPCLLVGLPTESTYQVNYINSPNPDALLFSIAEGGALPSLGYMIRSGIRSKISNHLNLNLGLYFASLSFDKDWPAIPERPLGMDFFRMDNGGWEVALQYCL